MLSRLKPRHESLRQQIGEPTQGLRKAEDIWKKHCWFGAPWKKKRIKEN
ncbi:mCG1041463 [Mus musculus]|nr:mCG1041463 [Mus musculus]